jgi:predicted TIM-barrel fold metal-dependent hydrolase
VSTGSAAAPGGLATDVHQHVWPPAFLDALRRRNAPPRLRGWTLELAGEPAYEVDPSDHDSAARAALVREDGLDRALVSLSSPLGIESLTGDEGAALLAAYHDGARRLPAPLRAWASASLAEIDVTELARQLDAGFVGLQLPATALADAAGYDRAGPLLELLERRDLPLFVHPGPAAGPRAGVPAWWPALVDYVAQMHTAWYAFRTVGRPSHPRLRVCFAMLAGLAPLHGERFAARAGERTVIDPDAFLETSSYGPRAIDAVVRVTGVDVLVHGSDRPYAPPPVSELGPAAELALRVANPASLLDPRGGVP